MKQQITNQTFDAERALYHLCDASVQNCRFEGPADGESAFKEARSIRVENCFFALRYPFWHVHDFALKSIEMTDTARAALWYSTDGTIADARLHGIKALRECKRIALTDCDIISPEFGWRSCDITMENCSATGEYFMFQTKNPVLRNSSLNGKYSFQYVQNGLIENCRFDTKDCFWHSKNVTVRNTEIKGEYLAWYSENLTLINCHITGTQPFCYCKNLRLIDCTMDNCDLAFEYSSVKATVHSRIDSVKNPSRGSITADSIGEIILGDNVYPTKCKIVDLSK